MPIYQYRCPNSHEQEVFFKSFKEAENSQESACRTCGATALKIPSVPLPAHFYGSPDGYAKPSPTKRYNTKLVSQIEGNSSAVG